MHCAPFYQGRWISVVSCLKGSLVVSVVTNRETYHVGEEAHLTCETTGKKDMETEIKWSKNGEPLPMDESDRYKRPSADVLVIERLLKEDTGEYRCTARRRNMKEDETESAPILIIVRSKLYLQHWEPVWYCAFHRKISWSLCFVHYFYYSIYFFLTSLICCLFLGRFLL